MSKRLKWLLHSLAMAVLVMGLSPAIADAAPRKTAVVKKKTTTVSKRVMRTFTAKKRSSVFIASVPARPSYGKLAGLHSVSDQLDLKSSVALVIDQDTREVLFSKNDSAVLPIASITKLMTGLVVSEAKLPMDEMITITQDDVDTEKGSSSRLRVGTMLTRGELMHLALMSSENRAAHALGRTYPGGLQAFVSLMNAKAKMLGMKDTRYVEPTGLSSQNQSSAHDLATLVGTRLQRRRPARTHHLARAPGGGGQPHAAVQEHQPAGEEPRVGHRPAEDRLHLRSRPVPGDAGQDRRPQAHHGVPGFRRQAQPHRRRRARAPLGRVEPGRAQPPIPTR